MTSELSPVQRGRRQLEETKQYSSNSLKSAVPLLLQSHILHTLHSTVIYLYI
ncbi:hypothetical protein EXN66_Car012277 [Channa argus]|uniref:Uncharacterized protein n=1 Tax=Channa argus TaxID=215402 RepID=A0A6G1Q2A9_CHAAH|nr:hypothetical protein EXN66_Car012277 [Channa argus]